jgi:hypothetical protein
MLDVDQMGVFSYAGDADVLVGRPVYDEETRQDGEA